MNPKDAPGPTNEPTDWETIILAFVFFLLLVGGGSYVGYLIARTWA